MQNILQYRYLRDDPNKLSPVFVSHPCAMEIGNFAHAYQNLLPYCNKDHLSKVCTRAPNRVYPFSTLHFYLAMTKELIVSSSTSRISSCCRSFLSQMTVSLRYKPCHIFDNNTWNRSMHDFVVPDFFQARLGTPSFLDDQKDFRTHSFTSMAPLNTFGRTQQSSKSVVG